MIRSYWKLQNKLVNFAIRLKTLHTKEDALEVVEWLLLISCAIVPMIAFVKIVMQMIGRYYAFTSWLVSLPFP